jgi:hypothetical protein
MSSSFRKSKFIWIPLLILVLIYAVLLIPFPDSDTLKPSDKKPFIWDKDALWDALEAKFKENRLKDCGELNPLIDTSFNEIDSIIVYVSSKQLSSSDPAWDTLEYKFFDIASMIGACTDRVMEFAAKSNLIRLAVKKNSLSWDMNDRDTRFRMYRLLYGGRMALEQVMLQAPKEKIPMMIRGTEEISWTPSGRYGNLRLHSGDILVSRGGAPVSALISRGSDFPGNFSHVALVYVDEKTHRIYTVESHIEFGVRVFTIEEYLADKKYRIMILRPNGSIPEFKANPMLPHEAAVLAYTDASGRHIAYDFEMNFNDPDKLFCSEVAYAYYKQYGIELWSGISTISAPGVAEWLFSVGVRNFETHEPSDLEYDPKLTVVAELRNPETLYERHKDDAILDVMLDDATEKGERLEYDWYMLPLARGAKLYSMILNMFEKEGPIPEGMSPEGALRISKLEEKFVKIKSRLNEFAEDFRKKEGYTPPYWQLVKMAKTAKDEIK